MVVVARTLKAGSLPLTMSQNAQEPSPEDSPFPPPAQGDAEMPASASAAAAASRWWRSAPGRPASEGAGGWKWERSTARRRS